MFFRFLSHSGGSFALATLLLVSAGLSAHAEDAATVLQKVNDRYAATKTYQGVLITHQTIIANNGQRALIDTTQKIYVVAPNKYRFEVTHKGSGVTANVSQRDHILYCDGKNLSAYLPSAKQYRTQPAPAGFSMKNVVGSLLPDPNEFAPLSITEGTTKGKPTYTLLLKMIMPKKMPPGVSEAQKNQMEGVVKAAKPAKLIVSKKDYSVVEVNISAIGREVAIVASEQSFDKPVSDTLFKFTPPPGSSRFIEPKTGGKP